MLPTSDKQLSSLKLFIKKLQAHGIRTEIGSIISNISYKIREAGSEDTEEQPQRLVRDFSITRTLGIGLRKRNGAETFRRLLLYRG